MVESEFVARTDFEVIVFQILRIYITYTRWFYTTSGGPMAMETKSERQIMIAPSFLTLRVTYVSIKKIQNDEGRLN